MNTLFNPFILDGWTEGEKVRERWFGRQVREQYFFYQFPGNKRDEFLQVLQVLVTCFEEFPGNFLRIKNSCDWFLRNYWEIIWNWSPIWEIVKESDFCELVWRNSWDFLRNFSQEVPENSSGIFLRKFLRNSQHLVTNFTDFFRGTE